MDAALDLNGLLQLNRTPGTSGTFGT